MGESEDRTMKFHDRREAGRLLAQQLAEFAGDKDALVLALPRGGVPVGYEIARALSVPLDIFLVRKLGVPGQEELAMGAIASGGVRVLNEDVIQYAGISGETIEEVTRRETGILEKRDRLYRGAQPKPEIAGRKVILVDDGLATGSTMRAALMAVRQQNPSRIIVAAPVASQTTCESFEHLADDVACVCGMCAEPFYAVGLWYRDFSQTTDEEVRELLNQAWSRQASQPEKSSGLEKGHGS